MNLSPGEANHLNFLLRNVLKKSLIVIQHGEPYSPERKTKKKKKISILIYNDIYEHFYIIVFEKHKHFTEKINV